MSTLAVNTIQAETGTTITIPTGKQLIVTDEGGLRVPGTVIQVVNNIGYGTRTAAASTSYIDVGAHTVTITPKAAGSKIMICSNFADTFVSSSATGNSLYLKFVRSINGGAFSNICFIADRQGIAVPNAAEFMASMSYSWLDVPTYSLGNAIVYKAQMKSYNTNAVTVGQQSTGSQMMYAMEIAQ